MGFVAVGFREKKLSEFLIVIYFWQADGYFWKVLPVHQYDVYYKDQWVVLSIWFYDLKDYDLKEQI